MKAHFRGIVRGDVLRFELPNLLGFNFLLHDSLGGSGMPQDIPDLWKKSGCQLEWFERIKVGDHLSVKRRVADVYQKAITLDPQAVWIVAEAIISNQRDETVCVIRNTLLTHRTPEEVAAAQKEASRA